MVGKPAKCVLSLGASQHNTERLLAYKLRVHLLWPQMSIIDEQEVETSQLLLYKSVSSTKHNACVHMKLVRESLNLGFGLVIGLLVLADLVFESVQLLHDQIEMVFDRRLADDSDFLLADDTSQQRHRFAL